MKNLTFIIYTFAISFFSTYAQTGSSLTIFSEDGSKFYLIINGVRQNDVAQTNVKTSYLDQISYNVKIIFEDGSKKEINRPNLYTKSTYENKFLDNIYKITKKRKRYKLRIQANNPIENEKTIKTTSETFNHELNNPNIDYKTHINNDFLFGSTYHKSFY